MTTHAPTSMTRSDPSPSGGRRRLTPVGGWSNPFGDPDHPGWERPSPGPDGYRRDALGAAALTAVAMFSLMLIESFNGADQDSERWHGYAVVATVTLPLVFRRRFPIGVLVFTTVAFVWGTYISLTATAQIVTQVAYFASVYAAVAWSRSRQLTAIAVAALAVSMIVWFTIDLTISSSFRDFVSQLDGGDGPLDPVTAYALFSVLNNVGFFGGAVYAGRASWRSALRRHQMREQAEKIADQSEQLARRAVVEERLRIARELHDVVAHHVSAIGIQAGAARKILPRDTQAAEQALQTVEQSSRQAVAETRRLLGVLRDEGPEPSAFGTHGTGDLPELVQEYADRGLSVTLTTAIDENVDPGGLSPALGLSVYRCVQESLANVLRHSTGRSVTVALRSVQEAGHPALELEVLDRGKPRPGTTGTGYGLVGLRERVDFHGGICEIGPRSPGPGWRVRARFPLTRAVGES